MNFVASHPKLFTKSGSAAILAGRICSSVPFKDRWAAIQAADAAESDPIERQASLIRLRNRLRQEGEKAVAKADKWIDDYKQSLLIDASLTPVQKLVAVRLLAEIDAEARPLVDSRFEKLWFKTDVIKSLEYDASLSPETRATAIELAKVWTVDWNGLINQTLPILVRSDAPADEYRRVLRVAEAAVQSSPDNFTFVTTLGCAQSRCGQYAESIATLTRSMEHASKSEKAPWTLPAELVGLSLAHHELGHTAEAQAFRQRLADWIERHKTQTDFDPMLLKELDQRLATKPK